MIVLYLFSINFKTMVTWRAWTPFFILVFHVSRFSSLFIQLWILYNTQKYLIQHVGLHYLLYFYPLFPFINLGKSITYQSWILCPRLTNPIYPSMTSASGWLNIPVTHLLNSWMGKTGMSKSWAQDPGLVSNGFTKIYKKKKRIKIY